MHKAISMPNLAQMATFSSVEELNTFEKQVRSLFRFEAPESAFKVFRFIKQHACKYPGVAWLKVSTIANALGLSASTVKRVIRFWVERGVLERRRTLRNRLGGIGASVYIIQPSAVPVFDPSSEPSRDPTEMNHRPDPDMPVAAQEDRANEPAEKIDHQKEQSQKSLSPKHSFDRGRRLYSGFRLSDRALRCIDEWFEEHVMRFFPGNRPLVECLWSQAVRTLERVAGTILGYDDIVWDALDESIRRWRKNTRPIHKPLDVYFAGVLRNMLMQRGLEIGA